jgi:hypothetical protein
MTDHFIDLIREVAAEGCPVQNPKAHIRGFHAEALRVQQTVPTLHPHHAST